MGGLLQKAATAGGYAVGGPIGGGLASFGSAALSGSDPLQSLTSGFQGMGLGPAGSSVGLAAAAPATVGSKFMSHMGFGNNLWGNLANGGNLLASAAPKPLESSQFELLLPPSKPLSLMDALNTRTR